MAARSIYPVSPQNLPFHGPLMSYINAHRSLSLHTKFIQKSKYFLIKEPFIVASDVYFKESFCTMYLDGKNGITAFSGSDVKIWITSNLWFNDTEYQWPKFLSSIFKIDNAMVDIYYQTLKYADLKLMASKGTFRTFFLRFSKVSDAKNMVVPIENIVELFRDANSYLL